MMGQVGIEQPKPLQDWVIGVGGFASVISMADVPAALSVVSDFSASFREIFSLRSFTCSKWQSRSFLPLLQGHDQWPFTFLPPGSRGRLLSLEGPMS